MNVDFLNMDLNNLDQKSEDCIVYDQNNCILPNQLIFNVQKKKFFDLNLDLKLFFQCQMNSLEIFQFFMRRSLGKKHAVNFFLTQCEKEQEVPQVHSMFAEIIDLYKQSQREILLLQQNFDF